MQTTKYNGANISSLIQKYCFIVILMTIRQIGSFELPSFHMKIILILSHWLLNMTLFFYKFSINAIFQSTGTEHIWKQNKGTNK